MTVKAHWIIIEENIFINRNMTELSTVILIILIRKEFNWHSDFLYVEYSPKSKLSYPKKISNDYE